MSSNPHTEAATQLFHYLAHFPQEHQALAQLGSQAYDADEDILCRKNMRGHVTTSALVLHATTQKVLVIHHKIYDRWLQPGGHFEASESLWASASREVLEETGVATQPHPWSVANAVPFDIDTHAIAANPAKGEGEHFHHDYLYLAVAADSGELKPQLNEVNAAKWMERSELLAVAGSRLQRVLAKLDRIVPMV